MVLQELPRKVWRGWPARVDGIWSGRSVHCHLRGGKESGIKGQMDLQSSRHSGAPKWRRGPCYSKHNLIKGPIAFTKSASKVVRPALITALHQRRSYSHRHHLRLLQPRIHGSASLPVFPAFSVHCSPQTTLTLQHSLFTKRTHPPAERYFVVVVG